MTKKKTVVVYKPDGKTVTVTTNGKTVTCDKQSYESGACGNIVNGKGERIPAGIWVFVSFLLATVIGLSIYLGVKFRKR